MLRIVSAHFGGGAAFSLLLLSQLKEENKNISVFNTPTVCSTAAV